MPDLPPMPAFKRDETWDSNDYLFYRAEHGIKESASLRARIKSLVDYLHHNCADQSAGTDLTELIDGGKCLCGLDDLLAQLRSEGLIE